MYKFPTLYKINSRGKKQYWEISTTDSTYTIRYGQEGGKEQETTTTITSGKNIGKSNETTISQQVISEAKSLWNKQIDKGYSETIDDNKEVFVRPMLAHSYADHADKIVFPCYGQPKLDGVRALYIDGKLISRKGKVFTSVPHIIEAIKNLAHMLPGLVLDGELYNHSDNFQDLVSYIRRETPSEETKAVEFHIYDCFYPDRTEPFEKRIHRLLDILVDHDAVKQKSLRAVYTRFLGNDDEVNEYHNDAVHDGYEGIMLRNAHAPYRIDKRSYDLLKVKSFQTDEFEIVGAEQNKGRAINQCTILCKTKDGAVFGVKPKGNEQQREWYWTNRKSIVGKFLTVKYFEWTSSKPSVPRFPIGLNIRDYE